ncbi:MAG: pur operon repressor, partial [Synergistota bacterium]|nr:pur operon repressor [Synergistota bacterium]
MKGFRIERLIRIAARFLFSPSIQRSITEMSENYGVSKTVISDDVLLIDSALR